MGAAISQKKAPCTWNEESQYIKLSALGPYCKEKPKKKGGAQPITFKHCTTKKPKTGLQISFNKATFALTGAGDYPSQFRLKIVNKNVPAARATRIIYLSVPPGLQQVNIAMATQESSEVSRTHFPTEPSSDTTESIGSKHQRYHYVNTLHLNPMTLLEKDLRSAFVRTAEETINDIAVCTLELETVPERSAIHGTTFNSVNHATLTFRIKQGQLLLSVKSVKLSGVPGCKPTKQRRSRLIGFPKQPRNVQVVSKPMSVLQTWKKAAAAKADAAAAAAAAELADATTVEAEAAEAAAAAVEAEAAAAAAEDEAAAAKAAAAEDADTPLARGDTDDD